MTGAPRNTRFRDLAGLAGFVALCLLVSAAGGWVTRTSVGTWYQELAKPAFTPPDWVFAPAWVTLYVLMGIAAWRVWRRAGFAGARIPLAIFAGQLALNLAWSVLFFGARAPGWALLEIGFLWIAIALTIRAFWAVDRWAGSLLVPYIAWVSFAALLNASVYALN